MVGGVSYAVCARWCRDTSRKMPQLDICESVKTRGFGEGQRPVRTQTVWVWCVRLVSILSPAGRVICRLPGVFPPPFIWKWYSAALASIHAHTSFHPSFTLCMWHFATYSLSSWPLGRIKKGGAWKKMIKVSTGKICSHKEQTLWIFITLLMKSRNKCTSSIIIKIKVSIRTKFNSLHCKKKERFSYSDFVLFFSTNI